MAPMNPSGKAAAVGRARFRLGSAESGSAAITPKDASKSQLVQRILRSSRPPDAASRFKQVAFR